MYLLIGLPWKWVPTFFYFNLCMSGVSKFNMVAMTFCRTYLLIIEGHSCLRGREREGGREGGEGEEWERGGSPACFKTTFMAKGSKWIKLPIN